MPIVARQCNGQDAELNNREVVGVTAGQAAVKWLLLGWVTVCRQVKPFWYITDAKVNSAFQWGR